MTDQFSDAAALMARVLGAPAFAFVSIRHPISSAAEAELAARAAQATAGIVSLLTAGS